MVTQHKRAVRTRISNSAPAGLRVLAVALDEVEQPELLLLPAPPHALLGHLDQPLHPRAVRSGEEEHVRGREAVAAGAASLLVEPLDALRTRPE